MASPSLAGSEPPAVGRLNLDLRDEADRYFRRRVRVVATGLVLGLAFIGVGVYEAGVLAPRGPSLEYGISLLLIALGAGVAFVTAYSGFINPVARIRASEGGIVFERRWGDPTGWKWTDADLRLDIDDRRNDPSADAEEQAHLFFEGPSGIYGNLSPPALGRLLSASRLYGAAVSDRTMEERDRRGTRTVHRIRVRPRPIR